MRQFFCLPPPKNTPKNEIKREERERIQREGVFPAWWSVEGCGGALLGVGDVKRGEVWWYESWGGVSRGVGGVVGCR